MPMTEPRTRTEPAPVNPSRPGNGASVGAFLNRSGSLLGSAAESAERIEDKAVRLAADEIASRAQAAEPKRRWFSRRPRTEPNPASPVPARTGRAPRTSNPDAPVPGWMAWVGSWLDRTVGAVPLLAPLVVSGWYTVHVGMQALALPLAVAIALTAALEGGIWKLARLYERTLVAGYSTLALRFGLIAYVAATGGLIYWHAHVTGGDWKPSLVVAGMSAAGFYIWGRQARWARRKELEAAGRVDKQLVRFSAWSWLLHPVETFRALRFAVRHRIDQPIPAMAAYRTHREQRRANRALARVNRRFEKAARKAKPNTEPERTEPAQPAATSWHVVRFAPNPATEPAGRRQAEPRRATVPNPPAPRPTVNPPTELARIGADDRLMAESIRDFVADWKASHRGSVPGRQTTRDALAERGHAVGLPRAGKIAQLADQLGPIDQEATA